MKKYKIQFLHTDNSIREVIIEAYNMGRAALRFQCNFGIDMPILKLTLSNQ